MADRKQTRAVRLNSALYAMCIEELIHGHTSRQDLMQATGLSHETILSLVRALRARKLIYIADWQRDTGGRASIALFAFGDKPDARKPKRRTHSENKKAYVERKRQARFMQAGAQVSQMV